MRILANQRDSRGIAWKKLSLTLGGFILLNVNDEITATVFDMSYIGDDQIISFSPHIASAISPNST